MRVARGERDESVSSGGGAWTGGSVTSARGAGPAVEVGAASPPGSVSSAGVGAVLEAASQASIPATRCYLTIDHQRFDFTGDARGTDTPFMALSAEYFLSPDALAEREGPLHRQALTHWAELHGLSEHAAWALHLACSAARDRTADAPPIPARR